MEFEGQYLTYEDYKGLGGTLDLMPFNILEFETRKQIALETHNRLNGIDSYDIPSEVKMCMFKLMSIIENYAKSVESASGNIASENTNGYSVTYITANQIKEIISSKNEEIHDIIMTDLYGVIVNNEHIIYAGV